jgi:Family of unknown function (DUF6390)
MTSDLKDRGILLHAKHAFMPNNLGYCGPDERDIIVRHLEGASGGEDLESMLKRFEAAYPFLRLIGRTTGRDPFDFAVPEAYWIGNGLLDKVNVADFRDFSRMDLPGRDEQEVDRVYKALGSKARPHHTFYVMSTYATATVRDGPNLVNDSRDRIVKAMDSCRVSWGKVTGVGKDKLQVQYTPLVLDGGHLSLGKSRSKSVSYNPHVRPFQGVKLGDPVSIHWDYACDVLSPRQVRNITKYTLLDIQSVNRLLAKRDH